MNRIGRLHIFLSVWYILIAIGLVLYSYSQIDLNLTLSANSLYQAIQQPLTQLGYYNRPLSTGIFVLILVNLFAAYLLSLFFIHKKKLHLPQLLPLICITLLLLFSYPAFSHDFFNYLFDARIVTTYGLDPGYFKALDFPADPWVRFMHWTHRYYPYGPGWLFITLVPSFLGFGKLVITMFLFKAAFAVFHGLNCLFVWKILDIHAPQKKLFGITFFALNPLVLLESLVSPHNEVMMLTFALLGIYLYLSKKYWRALSSLFVSISVKYLSAVLVPLFFFWRGKISDRFFQLSFFLWFLAIIPLVLQREPYTWYFVPIMGLAAITAQNRWVRAIAFGLSVGLLLRYLPYLYTGEYSLATQAFQWWSMSVGSGLGVLSYFFMFKNHDLI